MSIKKSTTVIENITADNGTFTAEVTKRQITEKSETEGQVKNIEIDQLVVKRQPKDGKQKTVVKLKGQEAKDLLALFLNLTGALVENVVPAQEVNPYMPHAIPESTNGTPVIPSTTISSMLNETQVRELPPNAQDPKTMISQNDLVKKIAKKAKREEDVLIENMAKQVNSVASSPKELAKRLLQRSKEQNPY